MLLNGDKGAKQILKNNDCKMVALEKRYAVDIDTQEDVKKYLSSELPNR